MVKEEISNYNFLDNFLDYDKCEIKFEVWYDSVTILVKI